MGMESNRLVIINNVEMRYFTTKPLYTDLSPFEVCVVEVGGIVRLVVRDGSVLRACILTAG